MDAFRALREPSLEEGRNFRHPAVRRILPTAQSGREEVRTIRLEPSRSEQVRFPAAFLAVNVRAEKAPARQQARACLCSLPAGKLTRGKSCGPTRQVRYLADGISRDSRHAVCSPVRRNSIGGESGGVDGSGGSEVYASTEVWRTPTCGGCGAGDQRFWEGRAGGTREKRC